VVHHARIDHCYRLSNVVTTSESPADDTSVSDAPTVSEAFGIIAGPEATSVTVYRAVRAFMRRRQYAQKDKV
jgi:hypothetical protein